MNRLFLPLVVACFATCGPIAVADEPPPRPRDGGTNFAPRHNADDELALLPRPGFTVELVASEPLIVAPVAFDWGADGKLWVVEMRDYPLGLDNHGQPGGRIVRLEDTDGDGRYDTSSVFLDGLLFPTGVMTWGRGALVTCAPEIFYAEDTDGDGLADRREALFAGFGEANPQHRVNGLRWGLDNWIYCANGDFTAVRMFDPAALADTTASGFSSSQAEDLRRLALAGAAIKSLKTGAMFNIRNRDFRFRPDEGWLDPQSGQAQFGRDRDDWGNWFGCNNAVPMWHFALDDHYLRRNPHVNYPVPRVEAPRSVTYAVGTEGRDTGTRRGISGGGLRGGNANAWTSACGITVYRDELLGPEFRDNWFTCEPVHNLVHREVLVANGTTFSSRRADDEPESEFLASSDTMFSPVMVRTAPDGALWVADIHRKVLEHPHWLPQGWEESVDVRAGEDQGRIYRVYPTAHRPRTVPRLDRLDALGLVDVLESSNGWLRDKAQQILIQRAELSSVPLLIERVQSSVQPLTRLHALCTLDGLRALKPYVIRRALSDENAGVRRHAVRLAEGRGARSPEVERILLKLAADTDPGVRLQLAYSLGTWNKPAAAQVLGKMLLQDSADLFISAAARSSLTPANLPGVVKTVLAGPAGAPAPLLEDLLKSAMGFSDSRSMLTVLERLVQPREGRQTEAQFAAMAGWLDALDEHNTSLTEMVSKADHELRTGLEQLRPIFDAARQAVHGAETPLSERIQAIGLLGRGLDRQPEDRERLVRALAPREAEPLQTAAVVALGRLRGAEAVDHLLDDWKSYTPALRAKVLDALLKRADGPEKVLEALRQGGVSPQEVPLTAQRRLLEHPIEEVRVKASQIFTDRVDEDRDKIVTAFADSLALTGDVSHGRQLFAKHCAACHRLGTTGQAVGPDLTMVRDKPPEWFLPALFDPSRAVEARYVHYVAVTEDGNVYSGVLIDEGGDRLTLVSPTGQPQVVLRGNLAELASTGKSAMPDGLEKELMLQDVADLVAFLRDPGTAANEKGD
ncbi:MAG TPA: PVC-type heme-binding CxxCH protein [Pirellulales bacterium]|nr:PVC-type heme-binding CxxCH protein [Pirellulales bacterium]